TAPAAGAKSLLQTAAIGTAGTYTITVSGAAGTTGGYTGQANLNAAFGAETHGGAAKDTLGTAPKLDGSDIGFAGGASRLVVLGSLGGTAAATVDFESGVLPSSFTTYSSNSFGRIQVTAPGGTGNSSQYALLMDSNTDDNYVLNEAVYTVDLTGLTQAL